MTNLEESHFMNFLTFLSYSRYSRSSTPFLRCKKPGTEKAVGKRASHGRLGRVDEQHLLRSFTRNTQYCLPHRPLKSRTAPPSPSTTMARQTSWLK